MSKRKNIHPDAEMQQFMDDLEESICQANAGEYARIHTPEQIQARRGRPVGSTKADKKVAVSIRLDAEVLAALKATGDGWQTRINNVMRAALLG